MAKLRKTIFLGFLGLATFMLAVRGSADANAREVKIALGLVRPPYIDLGGESGLEYEIIGAAFQRVGITLKPVLASLARSELLFEQGKVDGISTFKKTGLEGYASQPYIDYYNVAATLKVRNIKVSQISDLGAYSVLGYQTATEKLGADFRQMAASNPRYTEVPNQEVQVEQLLRGRVDIIVADVLIIKNYQRILKEKYGLDSEIEIHDMFPVNSYVVLFQDRNLRDAFNQGLAAIRKDKTYLKIISRHDRWIPKGKDSKDEFSIKKSDIF